MMFFVASKLLSIFVDPLLPFFLLLLGLLVYYWRYSVRRGLLTVVVGLYVLSTPISVGPVVRWLEGPRPVPETLQPPYDIAIVLSGMIKLALSTPDRIEFSDSVDRILAGIALMKQGRAAKLLISGGTGSLSERPVLEASLLRGFALEYGLRDEQILVDDASRNTYENARYTMHLLRTHGYQRCLLITSALHMRRAAATFHKQGLTPDLYPVDFRSKAAGKLTPFDFVPSAPTLYTASYAIHELVGLVMYRLQGYL
jgi:uncharacterized SAM-binding protein YcdF (DUF218 family)